MLECIIIAPLAVIIIVFVVAYGSFVFILIDDYRPESFRDLVALVIWKTAEQYHRLLHWFTAPASEKRKRGE